MNITVNFDSLEEMKAFAAALIEEGAAEVIKTANQTTPAAPAGLAQSAPQAPVQQPQPPVQPQVPTQPPVQQTVTQPVPQPQVPTQPPVHQTVTPPAPQPPVQQPAPQAPVQTPPVQTQPVATAGPQYVLDDLAKAAVTLQEAGRQQDLVALLQKYGVMSMTQLDPSMFGAFATDLRALGAQI